MNPVLADIYSTVIPSAPFIIAAYGIIWVVLLVYVVMIARGLKRGEAQVSLLERQMKADEGASLEKEGKSELVASGSPCETTKR